jgi:hypothetical protein
MFTLSEKGELGLHGFRKEIQTWRIHFTTITFPLFPNKKVRSCRKSTHQTELTQN